MRIDRTEKHTFTPTTEQRVAKNSKAISGLASSVIAESYKGDGRQREFRILEGMENYPRGGKARIPV